MDRYLDKALMVGFCILVPVAYGWSIYAILKADSVWHLIVQIFLLVFWTLLLLRFGTLWRESIPLLRKKDQGDMS